MVFHSNKNRNNSLTRTAEDSDDDLDCPFAVEPENGEVAPGESANIIVRFAPDDAGLFTYNLRVFGQYRVFMGTNCTTC